MEIKRTKHELIQPHIDNMVDEYTKYINSDIIDKITDKKKRDNSNNKKVFSHKK